MISSILPQCMQFVSALKGEEKPAKPEVTPTSIAQSPRPTELFSVAPSPTKIRNLALQSPVKSVQPSAEKSKPSLQEWFTSKVSEVCKQ